MVVTYIADPLAPALVGEHGAEHARAVLEVLVEGDMHARAQARLGQLQFSPQSTSMAALADIVIDGRWLTPGGSWRGVSVEMLAL